MKTTTPSGIIRTLLRGLFCLPFLALPLAAQHTSRLTLEQSTDLQTWQTVPITPAMLDANGKILVPSATTERFYRMQVEVLAPVILRDMKRELPGIGCGSRIILRTHAFACFDLAERSGLIRF